MIPILDTPLHLIVLLFGAGILAGAINAVAGGATFITFPMMIAVGLPPFVANATNFVALIPGNAMALLPLRKEINPAFRQFPRYLLPLAIIGGVSGSLALLQTGPAQFSALVPWMMLLAVSLYALTKPAIRFARNRVSEPSPAMQRAIPLLLGVATLVVAFYCGYFGAGIGFLFLALLTLFGVDNMVACQAIKNLSISSITVIAILLCGLAGAVSWPHGIVIFTGAMIGGWFGGTVIMRVPGAILHYFILLLGSTLTVGFFLFPPS